MPIERFDIVVDPATLHQSGYGSITGVIAITLDGWPFPETSWSDFPIRILSWWLRVYQDLSTRPRATGVCRFMDGPYEFRLASESQTVWTIQCIAQKRASGHGLVERESEIGAIAFKQALDVAAKVLARSCRKRSWKSRDLDELEYAFGLAR